MILGLRVILLPVTAAPAGLYPAWIADFVADKPDAFAWQNDSSMPVSLVRFALACVNVASNRPILGPNLSYSCPGDNPRKPWRFPVLSGSMARNGA